MHITTVEFESKTYTRKKIAFYMTRCIVHRPKKIPYTTFPVKVTKKKTELEQKKRYKIKIRTESRISGFFFSAAAASVLFVHGTLCGFLIIYLLRTTNYPVAKMPQLYLSVTTVSFSLIFFQRCTV